MNRPYDVHRYLGIVDTIRKKDPEIAIGTDIIVGFPGESDADFQDTLGLVRKAGFAYVHQFSFSSRTGTPAALSDGKIDARTMITRSDLLKAAGRESSRSYRVRFLASTLSCVIERDRSREGFTAVSDNYIKIELNTDSFDLGCAGTILPVRVTELTESGARGEPAAAILKNKK
jgi:tRNA A37 methylthiotransferase MiaB